MKADRNLDIMRAIAVLVVLTAHCLPSSPAQMAWGHYAVLVFFVHTCLVLLLSLRRQTEGKALSQSRVALGFYVQRAFRIYPLSVLCVLVTLAFRISWPFVVFTPRTGVSIAANLLLVQNFLHEIYSISPPLWSLPYEMQMYLVLPFLFALLSRCGTRVPVELIGLSIALPVLETVFTPLHGIAITQYFPCFMGGAIAFSARAAKLGRSGGMQQRTIAWQWWPVALFGVGLVYWRVGQAMLQDWLVCLLLGFVLMSFREAPPGILSRIVAVVARYSYGIYLSHAPLLWLCFWKLAALPAVLKYSLFGALICLVPGALYHAIEEPMIAAGKALSFRVLRIARQGPVPQAQLSPANG